MLMVWLVLLAFIGVATYIGGKLGAYVVRPALEKQLLGYVLVVVFSPVVLHMLPTARLVPAVSEADFAQAREAERALLSAAMRGHPTSIAGVRQTGTWRFNLSGHELAIVDAASRLPIVIATKDARDGIVEVALYSTPSIHDMLDVTARLSSPVHINFSMHTLTVVRPETARIDLLRFRGEISARQPAASPHPGVSLLNSISGTQVLMVRLPRNVHIKDPAPSLLFVEQGGW